MEFAENPDTNQNYLGLCDLDQDGLTFYNLRLADPFYKVDMTGLTVANFYLNENDALQNSNEIADPTVFFNTIPNQLVYARIENEYGCFSIESLSLDTGYNPLPFNTFEACDDDNNGITVFDLNELRELIRPEVSNTATISFYNSYNDVAYELNPLPDNYQNIESYSQEIYVEVKDIFRERFDIITLNVVEKPVVLPNDEIIYCEEFYPNTRTITAGLQNPSASNSETHLWFKNGVDISENTSTIEVNEAGEYKVIVSNASNCSTERTITVTESERATVQDVFVSELPNNNSISIVVLGKGEYEFALDDSFGAYQKSNVFDNVSVGFHTIFIKDVNGCKTTQHEVSILGFPKFFTPNNDGFNDTWKPLGLDTNSNMKVSIFNRFGKFLVQLSANGWDGAFNGQPLPSSDYWYQATLENDEIITGHFSLKR